MKKNIMAQVCELFKESTSIDYIRETLPDENVDEIIDCLMREGLLLERPKKLYMAGVLTYVVSDANVLPLVKEALKNGMPKKQICRRFHIGGTRLKKMIEKYHLETNDQIEKQLTNQVSEQVEQQTEQKVVEKATEQIKDTPKQIEKESVTSEIKETTKLDDAELKALIEQGLSEGKAKKKIASELHIGLKRLNKLANANIAELKQTSKKKTITSQLIAQVQTYLKFDTKNEMIAKNLSISVNAVKEIKRLLKLTKVPEGKETTETETPTIEEKIVYANKVYGVGKWKFLTREECKKLLRADNLKNMDREFDEDDFYDY